MAQMEVENNESSKRSLQTQLEESLNSFKTLEDGQLVDGTVIQVTDDLVFINIGYKSEGKIPVSEFAGELPKEGDVIAVVLVKLEGRNGPEVSFAKAKAKQVWKDLRKASDEKLPVEGKIEKEVKGGFDVSLGGDIHAFLPISQSDSQKVENPSKLIGIVSKFYIERLYSENKQNIVVNRRKYLEETVEAARDKFFAETQVGATVKGTVKSFTSFGAFIDIGGFDGLLHINDMSWGHVTRPKDFVKKGQEIELKVIRLDPAEKRINLSLKHFTEDPWVHFEEKFHLKDIVEGTVTKLTDFGAFIELEEGIEGLAHISEFSWTKKVSKASDVVKIGDKVKCMILGYDIQAGRVSLGLKQVTENPWDTIAEKYPVDSVVHGKVVKFTNNGAFVQLEEGIDGFLRGEDISWTKKVKHPGSELQEGQEIDVKILDVDAPAHRITVGIKQLTENPWIKFAEEYKAGSTLEGEITSITEHGVFVKAPCGVEGLVNKSNLSDDKDVPFEEAVKKYNVGDKINVYVVDVSVERERVAFSVKEFKKAQDRKEISKYMASSADNDNESYNPFADALRKN
ncbi:MAG: 30S ribosomal protein S1 [Treponema sp.]|nr:30S ribosomal protein S1 [Treponema sp.]